MHLECLKVPMVVIVMDTIGHIPVTFNGNSVALTAICLYTSFIFAVPMKEISTTNEVQTYLFNIFIHKGGSVATLNDNGTEFKNKMLNVVFDQLGIKRLFTNAFHLQGNAKVGNIHNFLKGTLTKFLDNSNLGMNFFHSLFIVIIYYQVAMAQIPHFLMLR